MFVYGLGMVRTFVVVGLGFVVLGIEPKGFVHTRQILYNLSHVPSLFVSFFFFSF